MSKKQKIKTVELNISSKTGRLVTEGYARGHPNTTQTEHRQRKK